MVTVQIPFEEYQTMKNELIMLKQQDLLIRFNELIELMFQNKYGLYLGDYTGDLAAKEMSEVSEWTYSGDVWNEI
jgi:hypothetical protein